MTMRSSCLIAGRLALDGYSAWFFRTITLFCSSNAKLNTPLPEPGRPGSGKGVFSFAFELQNKVIVRKNHAEYPSSASRPAIRHDDLMVIYLDGASNQVLANYFDSEGQQINYKVIASSDHEAVSFLSEPSASQPRYRLSYQKLKDGTLSGSFEIAPPGQSEVFKKYLEWIARKK